MRQTASLRVATIITMIMPLHLTTESEMEMRTTMNTTRMPGFDAEASLYESARSYWGHSGGAGAHMGSSVTAAATTYPSGCEIACAVADAACLALSALCGPFAFACGGGCQVATIACLLACQNSGGGGNGGGNGGHPPPPACCPEGRECACGGRCIPGKGCVGGYCLTSRERCP